jgi:O-antigen ligase
MAITIPIAIGVARRERGKRRLFALGVTLVFSAVVVKTGSRGGALALIAGAVVFALGFGGARKFYALAGLAITLMVGWAASPPDFRARMQSLTNVEDDYNYTAYGGRKQIWKRGRGYIMQHPLTGVGVGNFPIAEGEYARQLGRPAKWSAPHNAYLQAFSELGIPGGLIFVGLLFATAKRAWPMWRQTRSSGEWHRPEYLAALAAFAAGGYFLSQAYFYLLFGLCALIALADRARLLDRVGAHSGATQSVARSAGWRTARGMRPPPRAKPTVA